MGTAAGWHRDPTDRYEYRFWDGQRWTNHVGVNGQQHVDRLNDPAAYSAPSPSDSVTSAPATVTGTRTAIDPGLISPARTAPERITAFNAKKVATRLQAENMRLVNLVAELGGLDAAERSARIEEHRRAEADLEVKIARLQVERAQVDACLVVTRDQLALEEFGLFDFEHPAEASSALATDLEALRSQIRQTNKIGTAITATSSFTYNNSTAKGRTFVNQMSRIMLRAYNAEAENAVKTVKAGNLASAQKRLSKAREQIAKQGTMIDLTVTDQYHRLRLRELELAARHLQALAAAKEAERERRAELREQKVLEAEIKREKERLEKERSHYLNSIQRLRDAGDDEAARALQVELDRVDTEIAQADYRAANIRAGYVYVISNLGAFGEGVVKIGMTRRLDPMDRVRELGDASVPFTFDVHALFFSDDAVGVEAMLHREFAAERLNKVNLRKEFFRVDPQAVLSALEQHNVAVLEFRTHAAAEDFRASWPSSPSRTTSAAVLDVQG